MKTVTPGAFLSYVHDDNSALDGRIHFLAERLGSMVKLLTGRPFPVWLDRKDLHWGEAWKERIVAGLESSTFFIPVITPSYFESKSCREEFETFARFAAARGRNDLILPLYLIQVDGLHDEAFRETDSLARLLSQHQWADWREYAFEPKEALHKPFQALAAQIKGAIGRLDAPAQPAQPARPQGAPVKTSEAVVSEQNVQQAPPAKTEPKTFVVDPFHRGDFASIREAIKKAPPGARIMVRPGTYQEALVIDKPLEIIGDGPREQIEIEATGADVILFTTTMGRVVNLTLRQLGGGTWYGVDIAQGRLDLENCDIQSEGSACIAIHAGAAPRVIGNQIHHGKASGIFVFKNGRGTIEQNDIFGNALAGIEIKEDSDPIIRNNQIHNGKSCGIIIHDNGRGTIDQNDIFGNTFAGIEIKTGGNPVIYNNQIHGGGESGILIDQKGHAAIEQNDIYENTLSGIEVRGEGKPTVRKNRIYKHNYGIRIYEGGRGTFENNTLRENKKGPWLIDDDCLPHIKRSGNIEE